MKCRQASNPSDVATAIGRGPNFQPQSSQQLKNAKSRRSPFSAVDHHAGETLRIVRLQRLRLGNRLPAMVKQRRTCGHDPNRLALSTLPPRTPCSQPHFRLVAKEGTASSLRFTIRTMGFQARRPAQETKATQGRQRRLGDDKGDGPGSPSYMCSGRS